MIYRQYWDVFPKLVRVSTSSSEQSIPLSIRGEVTAPVYESSNPDVATVDPFGNIVCGSIPGASVIMVWSDVQKKSVRHVQVEVYGGSV